MTWRILHGDCLDLLRTLEPESIGSGVTDPPYGLSFMGRDWDSPDNVAFRPETWRLVLQVLKPGAYLVAFGGTRKFHRLMVAIEDAGFVLRDTLMWLYGQGMPKSHDVSKAIDRAAGAEREVVGSYSVPDITGGNYGQGKRAYTSREHSITAPATDAAKQWDGYGTALSPSWEPIVLAQKPVSGTIAGNVLEHGVGALNVDGCRLPMAEGDRAIVDTRSGAGYAKRSSQCSHGGRGEGERYTSHAAGRWPPNVALDEAAARLVDEQGRAMGVHSAGRPCGPKFARGENVNAYGAANMGAPTGARHGDSGGASRFFLRAEWSLEDLPGWAAEPSVTRRRHFYCPKSSTAERNAGLGDEQNTHPTVKPVALMRWLCRLVTPPGETVLDPFTGSGSTGCAAVLEGRPFVGLERDAESVRIARLRIHHRRPNAAEVADTAPARAIQPGLFDRGAA